MSKNIEVFSKAIEAMCDIFLTELSALTIQNLFTADFYIDYEELNNLVKNLIKAKGIVQDFKSHPNDQFDIDGFMFRIYMNLENDKNIFVTTNARNFYQRAYQQFKGIYEETLNLEKISKDNYYPKNNTADREALSLLDMNLNFSPCLHRMRQ